MRSLPFTAIALFLLLFPALADDRPWSEKTAAIGSVGPMPSGLLDPDQLDRLVDTGEALFTAKYTTLDGAGRPAATQAIVPTRQRIRQTVHFNRTSGPDSNACESCHHDPVLGGAADFVSTTFVSEGFDIPVFDSTDPQFSNERGRPHLFGAGLVELLAREMTAQLAHQRARALERAAKSGEPVRVALSAKGIDFGHLTAMPDGLVKLGEVEGIDPDLTVRPFSQKGVMTSLRQFAVNATNGHFGMQAGERFGARWTGTDDFDEDGHFFELAASDISALVAWMATRPAPTRLDPEHEGWREAAALGERLMTEFGCSSCHVPALPLESLRFEDPGPLDMTGTLNREQVKEPATYDIGLREWAKSLRRDDNGRVLVPLFGDLKRHKITDSGKEALGNELLSQRFVDRNWFMTTELWGVGSTAPYGHRNDFTTLDEIIRAHGGEAAKSSARYAGADEAQRSAIVAFLKTLVIEP